MKGNIVLITGAAAGIGYETARQFIMHGATVIGADQNAENLVRVAGELGDLTAIAKRILNFTRINKAGSNVHGN